MTLRLAWSHDGRDRREGAPDDRGEGCLSLAVRLFELSQKYHHFGQQCHRSYVAVFIGRSRELTPDGIPDE